MLFGRKDDPRGARGSGGSARKEKLKYQVPDEDPRSDETRRGRYDREKKSKRKKRFLDKSDQYLLRFAVAMICIRLLTMPYAHLRNSFGSRHVPGIALHARDAAVAQQLGHRLRHFSVEIFSSPKPFLGIDKDLNRRAIESWLRLSPRPRVTLLGNETGYEEASAEYGLHLETRVDKTFLGVPLFNSIIELANRSEATVAVVVNGDIVLTDDFMQTLKKTASCVKDFLLVAARFDVNTVPSAHPSRLDQLRTHVLDTGTLHTYGGMDMWAWNPSGPRLFGPQMPHFIFGRGKYDNWMTHEAIAAGYREVIDASETCLLVHARHDYHLVHGGNDPKKRGASVRDEQSSRQSPHDMQFWSEGKHSKFELFINIYLSLHVGTYVNQMGSVLYAPWKLGRCAEPGGMCFTRRRRPGMCPCEYSGFTTATQTDPLVTRGSRMIRCGMLSSETKHSFTIPVVPPPDARSEPESFGMPLTIRAITEKVAENNTVVLTALTFGYRAIMMNWVCNMRELGISNFVIASLDEDLYKYAFTRGLPTYFENTVSGGELSAVGASYGSPSFKKITKAKSRVVLRFLKLGYNVQWTDCDIIFFRNPLPYMWTQNADVVIQSNARDDEPANARRRLNSGFYLARATPAVVGAFESITDYARGSKMSEQPCFYDVLCGKEGENAHGSDKCVYRDVSVKVLPRELFPNGITRGIWNTSENEGILRKVHSPSIPSRHDMFGTTSLRFP